MSVLEAVARDLGVHKTELHLLVGERTREAVPYVECVGCYGEVPEDRRERGAVYCTEKCRRLHNWRRDAKKRRLEWVTCAGCGVRREVTSATAQKIRRGALRGFCLKCSPKARLAA